ncbi:MAG: IMP dehydrogenase [Planctomycetes bacterium]|nr:IMP dehydrogenase [Planctomycetota bacterium]
MAIEMARLGGLGILHRFCSIDREVEMIEAVKRKKNRLHHQLLDLFFLCQFLFQLF